MKAIYTTALIASVALTIPAAPFLAAPTSAVLHGTAPDLPAILNGIDPSAVPGWWLSGGFLDCPDGLLATWALCLAASLLIALSSAAGRRADDGGVLGCARIKSGAEAVRGSATWDGKSSPKARGFVYGYARGRYLFEPERFVLLDGSTGSGKSRFCLIPSIDLLTYGDGGNGSEPHSILASDVKSELVELTGNELARRGYNVLLLDTQHPMRGHRYNPLKLLVDYASAGLAEEAEQAADTIAAVIIPDEKGGAAHWTESGRALLSAVILLVAHSDECPAEAKSLATVYEVICRGTEGEGQEPAAPLKALFRSLPPRHPARSRASQFLSSGGNELRSIISTAKAQMRIFGSSSVAWMTSASDIDPRRLLVEKTALFLHVMDEASPYNKICTILLDQLWAAVQLAADSGGGALSRPFSIVGDEWGNIPTVASLPGILSLGRSYGLFWLGAVQNIAQLNKYGERDGRRKVLANCNVKVALKLGEAEDRQYFTELVGKTTRHTQGTSTSRGAAGSSGSTSYSEHADDVIHPWEWTERGPDRDGAIVVKMAMNGVPASHTGTFRTPLTDCTKTPAKEHFDLGTREHEREKRKAYQRMLDARAESHKGETATIWCPEWPEERDEAGASGDWDGLMLD